MLINAINNCGIGTGCWCEIMTFCAGFKMHCGFSFVIASALKNDVDFYSPQGNFFDHVLRRHEFCLHSRSCRYQILLQYPRKRPSYQRQMCIGIHITKSFIATMCIFLCFYFLNGHANIAANTSITIYGSSNSRWTLLFYFKNH